MSIDGRQMPHWPDWIEDVFTAQGLAVLGRVYEIAKASNMERSKRVSAEDLATAAIGAWLAIGRHDLVRDVR